MYTFFFTEASPFSQWYRCAFSVDGNAFNCAEQYMMHGKAVLFGDNDVALEILVADHPRQHKALGRKVKGFDDAVWRREREGIVPPSYASCSWPPMARRSSRPARTTGSGASGSPRSSPGDVAPANPPPSGLPKRPSS
jgi:hypothetical protein